MEEVKDLYDVDLQKIKEELNKIGAKSVLLQAPLGFKRQMLVLGKFLSSLGIEVAYSGRPCWGGCDLATYEAKLAKADAIVHLGHAMFVRHHEIPTIYVECRYSDPSPLYPVVDKAVALMGHRKVVGLGMTVQWLNFLDRVRSYLSRRGYEVIVGKPKGWLVHEGQVLGCDYRALKQVEDKVEVFLIVGSTFHALGLALISKKEVIVADPHSGKASSMSEMAKTFLMKRYIQIERFKSCDNVGIIVSEKPGQKRMGLAKKIESLLKSSGKYASIVIADEITESLIEDNPFEGYVNTACPRLSIEDQARFSKPLLLPSEVAVALGYLTWEEVLDKGLLLEESLYPAMFSRKGVRKSC